MAATYMREHQIHVNPEQMTPEVFNAISRTQIEAVNQASKSEQEIMCIDGNPLILYLSGKILFYHDNPELLELNNKKQEIEKQKRFNNEDLFKNKNYKNQSVKNVSLIEYNDKNKWYLKLIDKIKSFLKK